MFNLEEETKCDYLITKKAKKTMSIELDMLKEIIRICDKYDIKYFLTAGSMLGAVRHKGFIPWDDDIDVGMLRSEYEKFLKVAPLEFKSPYFLQTPLNDSLYRGHAQLRNSNTTAILKGEECKNYNQGIFIDIFPYDNVYSDKNELNRTEKKLKKMIKIMIWYKNVERNSIKNIIKYYISHTIIFIKKFENYYNKYQKICSKYSSNPNGLVSNTSFIFNRPKYQHEKKYFEDLIEVPFENLKVKIPREYDKILSKQYGDYMKFVKGTATHGEVFIDPEKSYTEYIGKDVFNEKI